MCTQYFGYDGHVLKLSDIDKILSHNHVYDDGQISDITLHGAGEPLLHPLFDQILKMIPSKIRIQFLTNGSLLHKWAEVIAYQKNITAINVSMDAISPRLYELIRGGSVDYVLNGLDSLNRSLAKSGHNINITINMTLMRINNGDLRQMIDFCSVNKYKLAIWPLISDQAHSSKWVAKRPGWVFNYQENIMSKQELRQLFYTVKDYAVEREVELIVDDFMTHDNQYGTGVAGCSVFEYNRLYFSDGTAKHCCLQTQKVFDWKSVDNLNFNDHSNHKTALEMKVQNITPDECKGSGCPFVGTDSRSTESNVDIDGGVSRAKGYFQTKATRHISTPVFR